MCMYCVGDRGTYGLDMNNKFKVALHKLYAKYEYKYDKGVAGANKRISIFRSRNSNSRKWCAN